MQKILQVSRRVENVLLNLKSRELPKYLIEDFHGVEGIVSFVGPQRLVKGNILIDSDLSPVTMDYIDKKIKLSLEKRKELAEQGELEIEQDSAFRAINQLQDGLPGLVVDVYGTYAVIHLYTRYWDEYVQSIARALTKNEIHPIDGVYLTSHIRGHKKQSDEEKKPTGTQFYANKISDSDAAPPSGLCIAGKKAHLHRTIVTEHTLRYHINLRNGNAPGLYIDQRDNRLKLAKLLKNIKTQPIKDIALYGTNTNSFLGEKIFEEKKFPTMLNVFSFTCSWSMIAAKMNASTTSLDLSPTSLKIGQENFKLNNLDDPEKEHVFWEKEAFSGLHALESQEKYFDVVLLDPPTFSRIRLKGKAGPPPKTEAEKIQRKQGRVETFTFNTGIHYKDLVELSAPLVSPGGYLITFCNTHSMERADLQEQVEEAFKLIYAKKQKQIAERRFVSNRRKLRLQGIKKSTREKTLSKMNFEPSIEEVQRLFHFELVDEWGLPADFEADPSLRTKGYLCGLVWRRSFLPSKKEKTQHQQQQHENE